jgi:2-haloacid dehalogenase
MARQNPPGSPVYVFDAYGTLFDVHSAVAKSREAIGPRADRLSELWRSKQLEYSWVRSLCGAYADFATLTAQALDFAAARCGGLTAEMRVALLAAYKNLDAYPDVAPTLSALREKGARLAILSNGTQAMLQDALAASRLMAMFDAVLSVDEIGVYKTDPRAYALVETQLGVTSEKVSFQSSNRWDIAGAVRFGFRANWINRAKMPNEYSDLAPAAELSSLADLLSL